MRHVTLALTLALASVRVALAPQDRPIQPPIAQAGRVAVGAVDIGRYEALYGTPEFRALDDESARPWPERSAIRTVGRLEEIPGRGRSGAAAPGLFGGGGDYDNAYAVFRVCARRHCLALVPVPEMQDAFAGPVLAWVHRDVEVIGAVDLLPDQGDPTQSRPRVFLVWSVFESLPRRVRGDPAAGSSLEALVRYPKGGEGRTVTASGTFRGANLFEDLPRESRRDPSDWVLKDGPFSIWVTGRAPKGQGWALDPRQRAECRWRLEVKGKVETAGGYVYLRATSVALVGRARPEP
jgi:hypothetical protein